MKTECCGRPVNPTDRYCPACGWEFRSMNDTSAGGNQGRDEWLRRYAQRFIDRAGLTPTQAQACATAEPFDVLSELFEDDPEGAADEEMSYWEP